MQLYERAEIVAGTLASAGYPSYAEELRSAIAAGATGTEILMAVRFHLRRAMEAEAALPASLRSTMRSLASDIDALLGD